MSNVRKFDKNTLHALQDFFEKGSYPKVNIIDFSEKIVIEAEVPGLDKSDVNVEVESNVLTILGNKAVNVERDSNQTGTYLRRELKRSSFRRSFTLGDNISKDTIDAKFENGILLVTLHKIKPNKPEVKKITVK